jgi:hypothetical protein
MNRLNPHATKIRRHPMSKPLLELELRVVDAPACASPGARVYALLPHLDVLLGAPGFGRSKPILLSPPARAVRFSSHAIPRGVLH